jgi:hypothetical protein
MRPGSAKSERGPDAYADYHTKRDWSYEASGPVCHS